MAIPEVQLWSMVLAQAAFDLHTVRRGGCSNGKTWASDARQWFESPQTTPGSFRWIAAVLDLDAATVRRKVFGLTPATLDARVKPIKIHRCEQDRKQKRVARVMVTLKKSPSLELSF